MDTQTASQRKEAVADAIASVRAEGLQPSEALKKRLDRYIQGKLTTKQVQRETIDSIAPKSKRTAGR